MVQERLGKIKWGGEYLYFRLSVIVGGCIASIANLMEDEDL